MNLYSTLNDLKQRLGISASADDAEMLGFLEGASRAVDDYCARHFCVVQASRTYPSSGARSIDLPDDLLSVSSLATDSEGDGTFDGEEWTEGADYVLMPDNAFPKWRIYVPAYGRHSLQKADRYIRITGAFGFGDGQSAHPWEQVDCAATAEASGSSLTLSADGVVKGGQTLLIDEEQVFVESVADTTATVRRGVNGTTAAAHDGAAISTALYPTSISRFVLWLAADEWRNKDASDLISETIGEYSYRRIDLSQRNTFTDQVMKRALGPYRRSAL